MSEKISQHEILPLKNDLGALVNRINASTKKLHDKIDKQVTLKVAIAYRDPKIYRQGLQAFYHVYKAIEIALQRELSKTDGNETTQILRAIWKPEIGRTARAERDLLYFYDGQRQKFENPIMPGQIKYVNYIIETTKEKPYLLLAYLHVMYLALFAGGRIMRSSVARATGLFPQVPGESFDDVLEKGGNFYTFDVEDENFLRIIYKRDYELFTRNSLTEQQKVEIIDESHYVFSQTSALMSELEQHNLSKIQLKWSYFVITRGYYVLMALLLITVLYFLRRIFLKLVV